MAKAQCARLTKFIIPSVTDRPTDSRNSSIPYANPSNRTPSMGPRVTTAPAGNCRPGGRLSTYRASLFARRPGVLDLLDRVDHDVAQAVANLAYLANVEVLHDVAGLGVNL